MTNNWRFRLGAIFPSQQQFAQHDGAFLPPPDELEPVLVVDDDEASANACAAMLRSLGYDPLIARSPDEAVALFLAQPVSIAIVDYDMPGRDGITLSYELTRTAETRGRKLHFIMASGYATKDVAIDAMRASAVDFLEKPIHQADLRKALQRIKGLSDAPAAREALLTMMASLRSELARLSQLIDDPERTAPARANPPEPPALEPGSAELAKRAGAAEIAAPILADHIRDLLKKEGRRRSIGGGDVFGDPAWEMLLDLLLARIEGRQVSVSSACIASGAPMSTALRLVGRLVEENVLRKVPDPTDRRRHFLIINPRFEQPLLEYLSDQLRHSAASPPDRAG